MAVATLGVAALMIVPLPVPHEVAQPPLATLLALCALGTVCSTAMIYASLKTIPAWRHPLVVPGYLLFAALNGWLLILWYQYNRRRAHVRRRQPGYFHQEELARSFNVSPQIISEMSQYNLLTVYHDQIGRIIDLKISEQQEEEEQ